MSTAGCTANRVTGDMLEKEGGYVHSGGDSNWRIPSGQVFYSPGGNDNITRELACARRHFFLPYA